MISTLLGALESFFRWLLEASWQASVLAALVLLLQWTLRDKLNPRWRHALWLLVVVRLVLPALPECKASLFQFAPPPPPVVTTAFSQPIFSPLLSTPVQATVPVGVPEPPPSFYPFSVFTFLALLWLTGALAFFAVTWLVNRRFMRHVTSALRITDPHLLALAQTAQQELGIHRTVGIIESTQVQGPAIMGLLRPTLVLPMNVQSRFTDDELRFIFLHEFAHLKRGDLFVQWLIALLQILHWFNPVLWYAFRRMRIDREPATDALVLSRAGEAEKESYGQVLVKLLEHHHSRHALPALVGILEDKDQFKRRFLLITKFTRGAYGWSLLGVLLLAGLAVGGLTKSHAAELKAAPTNGTLVQLALVLQDNAKSIAPDHHRLQILQAFYGADGSWKDVTPFLQKSIKNEALHISWNQPYAEIGGDPAYLKVKTLIVSYRLDGEDKVTTFAEQNYPVGLEASLPTAAPAPATTTSSEPDKASIPPHPGVMIRCATKIVQIAEDDYQAHRQDINAAVQKGDVTPLTALKSFDLISEPTVLTRTGQQGVLEVVRVLPYQIADEKDTEGNFVPGDFKKQFLGPRFVVHPSFADGKINFKGDLTITSLEKWTQTEDNHPKPVFHTRELQLSESFASNQTRGFEMPGGTQMEPTDPSFAYWPDKIPDTSKNPWVQRRIFLFLNIKAFHEDCTAITADNKDHPEHGPSAAQLTAFNEEEASKTPLMTALEQQKYDEARALLAKGADVNATDNIGNNALESLINRAGHKQPPLDLLKSMLATAKDPNPPVYSQSTPPMPPDPLLEVALMSAAVSPAENLLHNRPVVQILLDHGAKFSGANRESQALLQAAARGDLPGVQQAVAKGASVNGTDDNGWSPLLIACAIDNSDIANWLLDQHANVNTPSKRGAEDPLTYAADHGNDALVERLINLGAKTDLAWRAVWHAIDRKDQRLFDDLIAAGVDMKNAGSITGSSSGKSWRQIDSESLLSCIKNGQTAMAISLLEHGTEAEPANVFNNQNYTYWAVYYDRPEILQALLKHGGNPQLKTGFGETPLSLAQKKHPDLVPILEAAGKSTTMAPADAKDIVATVNGKPVYWWPIVYGRPDEAKADERPMAIYQAINNELIVQECASSKEATAVADQLVQEKLAYDLKGFYGDHDAFVANLKKNGITLEQYTDMLRREELVAWYDINKIDNPAQDYVDKHLPSSTLTPEDAKKQSQKLFTGQTTLLMNQATQQLRSKAKIELTDPSDALQPPIEINRSSTSTTDSHTSVTTTSNSVLNFPLPAAPTSDDIAKQLITATKKGDLAETQRLLDAGADPNSNQSPENESALFAAAVANQIDVVKLLLQHGGDPKKLNGCGNHLIVWVLNQGHLPMATILRDAGAEISPAAWASANGDVATLKSLVASGQIKPGKTDDAMKVAVSCGQMDAVKYLESVDGKLVAGKFLTQAADFGNIPMLDYILKQGADIKKDGGAAIDDAVIFFNHPEAVKFLLAHGVDVNRTTGWNDKLISSAKSAAMIKVLLDAGANPNVESIFGTALSLAPDRESVQLLVQHGANLKPQLKNGTTLIESVISRGLQDKPDVVDELIKQGAQFDPKTNGLSALTAAAWVNQPKTIEVLLNYGVDPNGYCNQPFRTSTALKSACFNHCPDAVRVLLAHGANPQGDPRDECTPLAFALVAGQWETAELLQNAGAHDVGDLTIAAAKGDLNRVTDLLRNGANINETTSNGYTPLLYAVRRGHVELARYLLEHGANIDQFDSVGMTAKGNFDLMASSMNPNQFEMDWGVSQEEGKRITDQFRALFAKYPTNFNYQNAQGRTALHQMAWAGATILPDLEDLTHPVHLNAVDHDGNTPLMLAVLSPHAKETFTGLSVVDNNNPHGPMKEWNSSAFIVDNLIREGARLDIKLPSGETVGEAALKAAEKSGNEQMISVLRDAMKDKSTKSTFTPPASDPATPTSNPPKDVAAIVNGHSN